MELTDKDICEELLLDIIYYEVHRDNLSPEMKYIFKKHIGQCPACRCRYLSLAMLLQKTPAWFGRSDGSMKIVG